MLEKALIAFAVAGAGAAGGYWVATERADDALHACQLDHREAKAVWERATRAALEQNARILAEQEVNREERRNFAREINVKHANDERRAAKDRVALEARLQAALEAGGDCRISGDAIRLLDNALSSASGGGVPDPARSGPAASGPDDPASEAAPPPGRPANRGRPTPSVL